MGAKSFGLKNDLIKGLRSWCPELSLVIKTKSFWRYRFYAHRRHDATISPFGAASFVRMVKAP